MYFKTFFYTVLLFCFCNCLFAQDTKPVADTGSIYPADRRGILYVAPILFTENGPGFGVSYERFAGTKKRIAVYVWGAATFDVANSNKIYNYNTGYYNTGHADAMFYLAPGIKFYPFGNGRKFVYAPGLAVVLADGKKSSEYYNYSGLNLAELIQKHFMAGALVQNSVHYNYTPRICLAFEVGIGGSIINKVGGSEQGNELLLKCALMIGFRLK